jgi:hypothetical protein
MKMPVVLPIILNNLLVRVLERYARDRPDKHAYASCAGTIPT